MHDTITMDDGTWDNVPTSFTYIWRRSDIAQTIVGATSNTYRITYDDVGHALTGRIVAHNAFGDSSAALGVTHDGNEVFPDSPAKVTSQLPEIDQPTFVILDPMISSMKLDGDA